MKVSNPASHERKPLLSLKQGLPIVIVSNHSKASTPHISPSASPRPCRYYNNAPVTVQVKAQKSDSKNAGCLASTHYKMPFSTNTINMLKQPTQNMMNLMNRSSIGIMHQYKCKEMRDKLTLYFQRKNQKPKFKPKIIINSPIRIKTRLSENVLSVSHFKSLSCSPSLADIITKNVRINIPLNRFNTKKDTKLESLKNAISCNVITLHTKLKKEDLSKFSMRSPTELGFSQNFPDSTCSKTHNNSPRTSKNDNTKSHKGLFRIVSYKEIKFCNTNTEKPKKKDQREDPYLCESISPWERGTQDSK